MSLLQQIKSASLEARKAKESYAVFLVTLYSEAARPGLDDGKRESTDEEVIRVLKKFKEGIEQSLAVYEQRDDEVGTFAAKNELGIVKSYLPEALSADELEAVIAQLIYNGATSMKDLMAALKANFAGRYDGKLASDIIKQLLQK